MKNLFKLSAIILALALMLSSLSACGAPLEPGQGKNKKTVHKIYIHGGNAQIEPFSNFLYSNSYDEKNKQWYSADGIGMFKPESEYISENKDSIPVVNSQNIKIDLSSNGTLSTVKIFRETDAPDSYELTKTLQLGETDIFADAKEAISELTGGTYYIALKVRWTGDFIDGKYESSGYTYYFKIVV